MKARQLFIAILFILLTFFLYGKSGYGFFVHDEWLAINSILYNQYVGELWKLLMPGKEIFNHYNPLTTLSFITEHHFFGFDYRFYELISIFTHGLNGVLLYFFALRWTKRIHIALPVALLFITNSISGQTIMWIGEGNGLLQATTLLLVSLHLLSSYLQTRKYYLLLFLSALVFVSLFFKEDTLFLLFGIPMFSYILGEKINKQDAVTISLALAAAFTVYFISRAFLVIVGSYVHGGNLIATASGLPAYPWVAALVPIKMLSQSIVPEHLIMSVAGLVRIAVQQTMVREVIVANIVLLVSGAIISYTAIRIAKFYQFTNEIRLMKLTLFSVVLIVGSALSYVFVPWRESNFSLLPSRYLYVASIGASIFVVLTIYSVWSTRRITKLGRCVSMAGFVISMGFIMFFHYANLRSMVSKFAALGTIRRSLLETLSFQYPQLPKMVIIFAHAPHENILPTSIGFGQMALVWYAQTEQFPTCLFKDSYLSGILEQDYKECDGRGFGYARTYHDLINLTEKNHLRPENIIAFSWTADKRLFIDITDTVRTRVQKDLR